MVLSELADAAIEAANLGEKYIYLKYGETGITQKYLDGPKSPQGRVIAHHSNSVVVRFNAHSVVLWCALDKGLPISICKNKKEKIEQ